MMMAIHRQGATPQGTETQDRRTRFRTDAGELLQPSPRFVHRHLGQEVQVQRTLRRNKAKNILNARCFLLRPIRRRNGGFDRFARGIPNPFPRRESFPKGEVSRTAVAVPRSMTQKRGDKLAQRIQVVEVRNRAAVSPAKGLVNEEHLCRSVEVGEITRRSHGWRKRSLGSRRTCPRPTEPLPH